MRELASRHSSAYALEALLDRCEALIDERFVLSIGENIGPVVFDGLANQFAHIERINAVVDPFLECLDEFGTGAFCRRRVADSPSAVAIPSPIPKAAPVTKAVRPAKPLMRFPPCFHSTNSPVRLRRRVPQ